MKDIYSIEFINRQSPQWWFNKAWNFHSSAAVLWHFGVDNPIDDALKNDLGFHASFSLDTGCYQVFPLLCGFAIENLLKGRALLLGRELKHTHKLVDLARLNKLEMNDQLKTGLEYLTECVIWDAKYPVPKKENYLRSHWQAYSDINWSWEDYKQIWSFCSNALMSENKMQSLQTY